MFLFLYLYFSVCLCVFPVGSCLSVRRGGGDSVCLDLLRLATSTFLFCLAFGHSDDPKMLQNSGIYSVFSLGVDLSGGVTIYIYIYICV